MSFYLNSILNSESVVETKVFTKEQLLTDLNDFQNVKLNSSIEVDNACQTLIFLQHASLQLEKILARENEDGFVFAAQMTLSSLGADAEESDPNPEPAKVKSRLVKIKDAIVATLKRITDAVLKFFKDLFSKIAKLLKIGKTVEAVVQNAKPGDVPKFSFESTYGADPTAISLTVSALEKINPEKINKFASNRINPSGIETLASRDLLNLQESSIVDAFDQLGFELTLTETSATTVRRPGKVVSVSVVTPSDLAICLNITTRVNQQLQTIKYMEEAFEIYGGMSATISKLAKDAALSNLDTKPIADGAVFWSQLTRVAGDVIVSSVAEIFKIVALYADSGTKA